jgi:Na+/H+ antiporter NhaD/arsenite permease-like protein
MSTVTSALLIAAAGVLLSVLFEYIPGLSDWYNAKEDSLQRLIMIGCLVVVSGGLYGLSCAGYLQFIAPSLSLSCDQQGLIGLLVAFFSALIANQSTFAILPKVNRESDSEAPVS